MYVTIRWAHRIEDDRIENYGAYIVFISKKHCRAEGCLSRGEIDELFSPPPPPSPSGTTTDHPYTLSLYLLGRSVGAPEGLGEGEGEESSSISPLC